MRLIEMAPVAVLLLLCAMQTIQAGPVMRFMQATAQSLHAPQDYIRGVLGDPRERSDGSGAAHDPTPALSDGKRRRPGSLAPAQSVAFARAYPSRVASLAYRGLGTGGVGGAESAPTRG